ncbi:MAG TPA: hypothetical protein VEZ70_07485 [Allosphingosinicella sp.]|nr:hypothetical protein [Allosphingosinicella sp.]
MVTGEALDAGADALAEAKAYLRIVGADEDEMVARLLAAAAAQCEQFTGKALIARGFEEAIAASAASAAWTRLKRAPVTAIVAVEGLRGDGLAAPLGVGGYHIDIDARGDGWVRITEAGGARRVRIGYRAGLAESWVGLPEPLRHGVIRLAAHLYTHRGEAGGGAVPAAASALWRPWRRLGLRFR